MIFVDTGVWFARLVPADPDHARVKNWFDHNQQPLFTSDYVVDETLTLLRIRRHPQHAIQFGQFIFERNLVNLEMIDSDRLARAWRTFHQFADQNWSFTDCTSKVLIEELHTTEAAALDAHFKQFGLHTLHPS